MSLQRLIFLSQKIEALNFQRAALIKMMFTKRTEACESQLIRLDADRRRLIAERSRLLKKGF